MTFKISTKSKTIALLFCLLVVYGFLSHSIRIQKASAFSCNVSPDPWYEVSVVLNNKSIPTGIKISVDKELNNSLIITNSTSTPFYFIKNAPHLNNQPWEPDVFDDPGIPLGYLPVAKITNQNYYVWSNKQNGKIGWYEMVQDENPEYIKLIVSQSDFEMNESSAQIYQDNRPDVKFLDMPSPQSFKFNAYFNNKILEISGTQIYTINKNYRPNQGQISARNCDQGQQDWLDSLGQDTDKNTLPPVSDVQPKTFSSWLLEIILSIRNFLKSILDFFTI